MTKQKYSIKWPWSKYTVNGKIRRTGSTLKVSDFVNPGKTPGNVGICFSGGGSVAMISALGQLRALRKMKLLEKARAISSVSGGSWALVPYTYLPDEISDDLFLGEFCDDPSLLNLKITPEATSLGYSPKRYLGSTVSADGIKWENLAKEALELSINLLFPNDRIWTFLIAKHILKPFELSDTNIFITIRSIQNAWFAYSKESVADIRNANPNLPTQAYNYQQSAGRTKRPFHLCNASMFITPNENADEGNALAPLQCTAFETGILSDNLGKGYKPNPPNEQQVGGGMISSYCFNGIPKKISGSDITIKIKDSWAFSLADITANSSAFFATGLKKLESEILAPLDPKYHYWPVGAENPKSAQIKFADGGANEDTGICNMLAYDDIDSLLVFVNSLETVWKDPNCKDDSMNIVVDYSLPPLFGYTPYQQCAENRGLKPGYNKYNDLTSDQLKNNDIRYFQKNQVFESKLFPLFIQTIWKNLDNYKSPAIYFNEEMNVMKNDWYKVDNANGNRKIKLCLVHYGPWTEWTKKLSPPVCQEMTNYVNSNKPRRKNKIPTSDKFPNFLLIDTYMPAPIMNLFAHFTSNVAYSQEKLLNEKLFVDGRGLD